MSFSTDISGLVKTLYRKIFDRDLEDQASLEYWTNHVRFHGISSTISILFSSDEIKNLSREVIVDKLYSSILEREGEWDGKNYFLRRLDRGDAMQTIVEDFVGSTEYRQKAQTGIVPPYDIPIFTWNPAGGMSDFINTLYQNILSRDPLPEDHPNLDNWLNHTHFHGIASTISGFFAGDEFKAKNFRFPQEVIVDKLYRSILGREGRWDGKNYWIDRLRHGDTVQTIVSDCIESEEYKQKAQAGIVPSSCIHILTWHSAGGISHFITTLYHNVLSREVQSDDNIDNWINHVRFHGIASTITGFFTSNEFQTKNLPLEVVVDKLYRSVLGREGRGDEKNIQLDRLRGGLAIHIAVNDLVGSDEYKQKAQLGAVPSANIPIFTWNPASRMPDFVKTLYQNILSRDPDNEGSSHWTNHTRFFGIASTIGGIFTCDEFQDKHFPHEDIVDKLYRSILGRECRGDERTDQVVRLSDGVSISTIVKELVGSDEYTQKAQLRAVPLPDIPIFTWNPASRMPGFVKTLYHNILSRDPNNDESSHWTNHTRFFGIASTISGIFTSNKFQAKHFPHEEIVDKLYRSILGRECRGDERTAQVVRLRDGVSICTIIDELVGSDEYRQKAQLGTVPSPDTPIFEWASYGGADDFSRTLYQNIFSRDPEEGECVEWGNHTRSHGVASTLVGFFTSDEFHRKRFSREDIVDKLYRSILGRECRSDEKIVQVDRLKNGTATCLIIYDLVGSDEYKKRVQLGAAPYPNVE